MRKFFPFLFILLIIISICMIPMAGSFAGAPDQEILLCDDCEYIIQKDGTLKLSKYIGPGGDLEIPEELDGMKVTYIGDYVFYGCNFLTGITIPDSVIGIGNSVFWNCTSLTEITIPDSVKSIGEGAFYGCSSLTGITIPGSVISIGKYALSNCSLLTATVPRNSYAAQYCAGNRIKYMYLYPDVPDEKNP